jgi:hypothetical protein
LVYENVPVVVELFQEYLASVSEYVEQQERGDEGTQ